MSTKNTTPEVKIKASSLRLGPAVKVGVEEREKVEELFSLTGQDLLVVEGKARGVLSRLVWEKAKRFGLPLSLTELSFGVPELESEEEISASKLFSLLKNPLNCLLVGESLFSFREWEALGLAEETRKPPCLTLPAPLAELREKALSSAEKVSVEVFLVGGVVRDLLLGLEVFDLDLVVTGKVAAFVEVLAAELGARPLKRSLFETFKLDWHGLELDVAQSRWEYYEAPAKLPRVFPGPLLWDLFRRDFTVNAMALRLKDLKLIDPYGGLEDLKKKRLEILHPLSFVDDPTRIFRAARYATRFGLSPSENLKKALSIALSLNTLTLLTPARLRNEVLRILKEKDPVAPLLWLSEKGVFKKFGVENLNQEALKRLFKGQDLLGPPQEALLEGLLLTLNPQRDFLIRFGIQTKRAKALLSELEELGKKRDFFADTKVPLSEKVFSLERFSKPVLLAFWALSPGLEKVLSRSFSAFGLRPALNGEDLKRLGVPAGPLLGKLLKRLRAAKIDGQVKGREEEIIWLKKEFPDVLVT